MSDKIRLSPSRIDTLDRCSLQEFLSYEAKIKLRPSGKMIQGTAVDDGLSHNYRQKIVSGSDMLPGDVKEIVAAKFEEHATEACFEEDEKPGKLKDQAVHVTGVYQALVAPAVQPLAVQESLNLDFPNQNYEVMQYADVIEQGVVRDTKVTGRRMNEAAARGSFQLMLYAIGYESQMGELPQQIVFDRLLRSAKKGAQPQDFLQQVSTEPSTVDRQGVLLKLQAAAKRIELSRQEPLGLIYPADPAKPNSPCSWCGYAKMCVPAGKPWWRYLLPDGIELARSEARRILTEDRLALKVEKDVRHELEIGQGED